MTLNLIDVAKKMGSEEFIKSYWNTFHCQEVLLTADGRMHGTYCKNRFCTLCCSIRKARIINDYLPIVKSWSDPHFVTLTVLSLSAKDLHWYFRKMVKGFDMIKDKYRKRAIRGKDIKLVGIRSLECNFNREKRTYNPHLHVIVENKLMADILIEEWMKLWTRKKTNRVWVRRSAQFSSKVINTEKSLIEIVKYGSKIFTEPDLAGKSKSPGERKIYVAALHNIFSAMRRLRIFERFGFNLPKKPKLEGNNIRVVQEYDEWAFNAKRSDWINVENQDALSYYQPLIELIQLLANSIDTFTD